MQENSNPVGTAFEAVTGQLRELFAFRSLPACGTLALMRSAVEVNGLWQPDGESGVTCGSIRGHAKPLGIYPAGYCAPLTDKLLSDLGYDLGLPVATSAFQGITHRTPGEESVLVSVTPDKDLCEVYDLSTGEDGSVSDACLEFLRLRPHLVSAFLAINIFDLWIGNPDRNLGNMLTNETGLFAIDQDDNILLSPRRSFTPEKLYPFKAFTELATPQQAPVIALTLQAIESFPPERIATTADRLTPLDPAHWKAAEYSDLLTERRPLLRPMLMDVLSPATRKAVAALA